MIAFFGGSFDPIHLGHIHLAKSLQNEYQFEKFYFVPAKQNPLKSDRTEASNMERLELMQASLKEVGEKAFAIWPNELYRSTPSYTFESITELLTTEKKEIVLILGDDAFKDFSNWYKPKEILKSVNLIVVVRSEKNVPNVKEILRSLHIDDVQQESENRFTHCSNIRSVEIKNISALPVSATSIRNKIKECWNTGELDEVPLGLQRSVWLLIKANGLYARK